VKEKSLGNSEGDEGTYMLILTICKDKELRRRF